MRRAAAATRSSMQSYANRRRRWCGGSMSLISRGHSCPGYLQCAVIAIDPDPSIIDQSAPTRTAPPREKRWILCFVGTSLGARGLNVQDALFGPARSARLLFGGVFPRGPLPCVFDLTPLSRHNNGGRDAATSRIFALRQLFGTAQHQIIATEIMMSSDHDVLCNHAAVGNGQVSSRERYEHNRCPLAR